MLIALLAVLAFLKNIINNRRGISEKEFHKVTNFAVASNQRRFTIFNQIENLEYRTTILKSMNNFHNQSKQISSIDDDQVDETLSGNTSVIVFKPGNKNSCFEIVDKNVNVICSSGTHDHGSSKVKLKNIVDYKWETKYYLGHLIAVHMDGKHIAYVINVSTRGSRMEGMVRVVNAHSAKRALIKGMCGEVLDIQFAQIEKERILGSIDMNALYIHKIEYVDNSMVCNMILKIDDPLNNYTPKYDKITWCPIMSYGGSSGDEEESHLIIWSRGSTLQCFNIKTVIANHGTGRQTTNTLKEGYIRLHDDSLTITWVALAPDGSTFSVGTSDGFIRFYQIYLHDKEPRCLHQWKPHNGKPISSFFFLDNLTKNASEFVPIKKSNKRTYWNLAITAAANNTEFKVWDCGAWKCLQTLKLKIANDDKKSTHFLAEIDRTSSYLVISNQETRNCYVMQLINNGLTDDTDLLNNSSDSNKSKSKLPPPIFIKSISEFHLSSGILSFSIVDAAVRRYKFPNDSYCEEMDEYDEETNSVFCVVVRMFIVQSKSMQECNILYQPTLTENAEVKSSISYNSSSENEGNESKCLDGNESLLSNGKKSNTKEQTDVIETNIKILQKEKEKPERNPLEKLLGISSSPSGLVTEQIEKQNSSTTTTTTTVKSVSAAGGPSTFSNEKTDSQSISPRLIKANSNSFSQLNLMTPDAFSATTNTKSVTATNDKKTPDIVSSDVLNTILMLASVTGQSPATKNDNVNLLNLVNNKIIEDQEHQKIQLKQQLESQKKFVAIDNNPGRENLASGGSSPSREVQEILSLHEYDKSSYSGDELLDDTTTNHTVEAGINEFLDVSVTELDGKKSNLSNWPKTTDVAKMQTKHSTELQNAANLITQAVNSSSGNLNSNHPPTLVNSGSRNSRSNLNLNTSNTSLNSDLAEINVKMNQLIDLVKSQSAKINSLQIEVSELKKNQTPVSTKNFADFSFKLEMQLSKLLEQYLKRYESDHKKKLATFMSAQETQLREMRDTFLQITNQFIVNQIGDVVSKIISMEIQRQLSPLLGAKIDNMQKQLQMDVTQKMSNFDIMLKESIAQACKSKNIIDAFGKSVLVGVQGSLQAAFIESMSSTLIPAYEKSSQNMFKQLHDAFSVGIKEFVEQFKSYLQHLQPMHDSTNEIINKLSSFVPQLDQILIKHRNTFTDGMLETRKDIKSLEILLVRQIQETLRVELRKAMDQSVTLRSQANTPAPVIYDLKETIKQLLQHGQINKAFHQALLANDLSLVEFTLKNADQSAVFIPECCLEQKVLLSLIQQISADMSNHNEIKQNYLAEAILAINPRDSITREHAPKVLHELFRNCQMFLLNYPKSPQCSNVRMVLKAATSFREQFQ